MCPHRVWRRRAAIKIVGVVFLLTPPAGSKGRCGCATTVLYRPLNAFVLLALTYASKWRGYPRVNTPTSSVELFDVLAVYGLNSNLRHCLSRTIYADRVLLYSWVSLAPSAAGGDHSSAVQPIVMSACRVRGQCVFIQICWLRFVNSSRRSHSHYS